jgi:hypothetical protein
MIVFKKTLLIPHLLNPTKIALTTAMCTSCTDTPRWFQNASAAEHMKNKMFPLINLVSIFSAPLLSRMLSHFSFFKKKFKLNIYIIALLLINVVIPMPF